jgi:predicted RNA-binding protein
MCEANAYIVKDGQEELVMESVYIVEPEEDHSRYRLVNIFGEHWTLSQRLLPFQSIEDDVGLV